MPNFINSLALTGLSHKHFIIKVLKKNLLAFFFRYKNIIYMWTHRICNGSAYSLKFCFSTKKSIHTYKQWWELLKSSCHCGIAGHRAEIITTEYSHLLLLLFLCCVLTQCLGPCQASALPPAPFLACIVVWTQSMHYFLKMFLLHFSVASALLSPRFSEPYEAVLKSTAKVAAY